MVAARIDEEIAEEVQTELQWALGRATDDIGIKAHMGLVTLTGKAESYATKMAAQELAHRVPGVTDVANEITVRVRQANIRSDAEIARAVRNALEWDALVPHDRITSTVSDGFVTLEGTVRSLSERNDAEYIVRRLAGVRGVHDAIEVLPPRVAPEDLRRQIEEALQRRAVRQADRIDVSVDDGSVTLSGKVQSWDEKRAIIGLVSHALGVRLVNDHLSIRPWV